MFPELIFMITEIIGKIAETICSQGTLHEFEFVILDSECEKLLLSL